MVKCTFCGQQVKPGTGKIFVYKDGKTNNFCSSKCEKNMLKLKRKPIATKWSSRFIKTK
ncbi:50S ribosomal protein L24e [Candidatus Woesearchaeota archaeon]|nr:50S ribosomal protein L24e [Candidatus Woesearchaeota archaeon]